MTDEEVDEIGDADAPVTAGGAKGGDAPFVDPLFHRAWIYLQQGADLVGGQELLGVEVLLSHGFHVLAVLPVSVNLTKVS